MVGGTVAELFALGGVAFCYLRRNPAKILDVSTLAMPEQQVST